MSNHKNQTFLIFTIPGRAASDRIPAIANESRQIWGHHLTDIALCIYEIVKLFIQTEVSDLMVWPSPLVGEF